MGSLQNDINRTQSVVYVKWHDAHAVAPSWVALDDIVDEPAIVESVGWLIPDSITDHIVLAQSVIGDEGDHILAIPVGMVREMRVLFSNLLQ
jgi:hypothetical protein